MLGWLHKVSYPRLQLIEAAATERYNIGAGFVITATLKATQSTQRNTYERRSGKPLS